MSKQKQGPSALNTWIFDAAYSGSMEDIKNILDTHSLFLNWQDFTGRTPLMRAIEGNHSEVVNYLIERGADLFITDHKKYTALMLAAETKNIAIANALIAKGGDLIVGDALIFSAETRNYPVICYLVENCQVNLNAKNRDNMTILIWAVNNKKNEVLSYCVEHGADVNAEGALSQTPLMAAVKVGSLVMLIYLLSKGAEISAQDRFGRTALLYAAQLGQVDIVRHLIEECREDINTKSSDGKSAWTLAAQSGHDDVVMYLAAHYAEIPEEGWTRDYQAAACNNTFALMTEVIRATTEQKPPHSEILLEYTKSDILREMYRIKALRAEKTKSRGR